MTTIITKNSSTAGAVPLATDLVQGELAVNVTDKKLFTKNASGTVVDVTPVAPYGFKNKLINAQGLINQRAYVSGTATSGANQYTVDRWRVVTSGQNLTISTTNNVTTFTAPAGGVEQVIEGLNLESGTYVLSWTGTATATVAGSAVTNGGTITVVGGTNTTVKFSSGTFSLPQFEKGSTATSFDYRPYGTELALCQRYCEALYFDASGFAIISNAFATLTNQWTTWPFSVSKRAQATVTLVNGSWSAAPTIFGGVNNARFNNNSSSFNLSGTSGQLALLATAEL